MTKADLRTEYRAKRNALSESQRLKLNDLILIRFQQASLPPVNTLLTYWPVENEPDTPVYTRYLEHMMPGLQVAYPVTRFADSSMEAMLVTDDTEYQVNRYGLTEPAGGTILAPAAVDLVFVPLLAFDEQGYRVGYGKGFYDRYLHRCRPDVIKVGFSYFPPVAAIDDTGHYDVPLTLCITPEAVYEF